MNELWRIPAVLIGCPILLVVLSTFARRYIGGIGDEVPTRRGSGSARISSKEKDQASGAGSPAQKEVVRSVRGDDGDDPNRRAVREKPSALALHELLLALLTVLQVTCGGCQKRLWLDYGINTKELRRMYQHRFNEKRCPSCGLGLLQKSPTTFECSYVQCELGASQGYWEKNRLGFLEWKPKR